MLSNAPLAQPFTVLQPFGANPSLHSQILMNQQPLLGHEGMDLQAPPGKPVAAVQSGSVLCAVTGHSRYGAAVLLEHEWGQSLYANLARLDVRAGESVKAGQTIASLGEDTQSAPAHLHFGLRIQPFATDDGWMGYSDPAPYLARLAKPRGPVMGPHIIGPIQPHLELLRQWQPRLITVLDPNPDEMALLRTACPDAIIIGRIFVADSDVENRIRANPEAAAQWAHELTMQRLTPHVNYWQIANEVLPQAADLPLLARFEMRRMQLAAAAMYFCAIFAFSVGNPDLPVADRMGLWRLLYPAIELAEQAGHIVTVHQYGAPDVWKPDQDWYGYRLEHQVLRRLPFKQVQFAVSEYGIDGLIQGGTPRGWQSFTDANGYAGQLIRSGRYLERFSGRVLGYSVFTLGHNNPWQTYEISGAVADQLATQSPRGTWQSAQAMATGIGPAEPNRTADLGTQGTGGSGGQSPEPNQPVIVPVVQPNQPSAPATGIGPSPVGSVTRRVTEWADDMRLSVRTIGERPDVTTGDVVYIVKDIFTTRNGSWDVTTDPYAVPQWAKDAYLSGTFQKAYEKSNLYAAVIGLDGQFVTDQEIVFWTGGLEKLNDLGSTTWEVRRTSESPGWGTLVMFSSSSYDPSAGQEGPWCWTPNKPVPAEVVCGGGLPNGENVSTFVVWQAVNKSELDNPTPTPTPPTPTPPTPEPPTPTPPTPEPPTPTPPTPTPTPEPPTPTPTPTPTPSPSVVRRLGSWVERLNLQIKEIKDRPDPAPTGDYVYLIKDVFTTRDGNWEPSSVYGSVDQWARDAYLKPFGDPEYFDDAGADHHLFAAILDKDGKLLKNMDMLYWSDGFAQLGNPTYNGYVWGSNGYRFPRTKERSGWANIIMSESSNYVPERGETGPWCWTPYGLPAEVMCGAGMPAKQHVSVFAVWQAVPKSTVVVPPPVTGDFRIYMPGVMRDAQPPAAPSNAPQSLSGSTVPPTALVESIRRAAWGQLGLAYEGGAPLAEYARRAGLGAPLGQVFETAGHLAQAFYGGIAYAPVAAPNQVAHILW